MLVDRNVELTLDGGNIMLVDGNKAVPLDGKNCISSRNQDIYCRYVLFMKKLAEKFNDTLSLKMCVTRHCIGTCTNPRMTNPRTTIPNATIPRTTNPRTDQS
jgi:hypothetical protein